MSRIVITGGCGFLGGHLVDRLVGQGTDVTVYDMAPPPPDREIGPGRVRHVVGDVRDAETLASAITADTEIVYHLSAVVGVDRYLSRPLDVIDTNVMGTRNVLRRALDVGAKVLLASTSEVYGRNPAVPWSEGSDRVLGATSAERWSYSSSKALAEHLTYAFMRQAGLRATIVRYFNLYGPRQRPSYVISRSVHRVLNGLPPIRYDDGRQTRCFTYVADAVAGTVMAAESGRADGECLNIGSDRETPIGEAIDLVCRLAGANAEPLAFDTAARLGDGYEDVPRRIPDTAKAGRLLGWRCETSLHDGLVKTIEWARRSPWWRESPVPDRQAG
ncbi:NAD-dependent epimerase/dehydratase family protein [Actinoallomurus iriomotensis]|uniref:UDP-glucose 4-epimerase n=1 Tax=Actinoallomurus iriomotensis TaxID=478107 RepID=A0A9W6VQ46_9ACTN|nr:NAD-dependent epimerase/dehydratase family protein [Actinoallomurus iriomotensis]GLY75504.1 UDP-glucose 4-epimerase [Actinoallomurus iriomotensis]